MKTPINLTPIERVRLKLVEYTASVVFLNIVLAILSLIATGGKINVTILLTVVGGQAVLALFLAVLKYFTAQGDAPLVIALESAAKEVATELHTTTASVIVPDLPVDLVKIEPTQLTTKPLPVLQGISLSVGGEPTTPRMQAVSAPLPPVQATTPQ
jgi:hypothetical protein